MSTVRSISADTVRPLGISTAATTTGAVSTFSPPEFSRSLLMPTAADPPNTRASATTRRVRKLTAHLPGSRGFLRQGPQDQSREAHGHRGGEGDDPLAPVWP